MNTKKNWLDVNDVARLLGIPVVKVQRWVHQGKIPCKYRKRKVFFRSAELLSWARSHDLVVDEKQSGVDVVPGEENRLFRAVIDGGVQFGLIGDDIYSVLHAAAERLAFDPPIPAERIFEELLAREEMASTGIGRGVAIPHPRNMRALEIKQPQVTLFFLENPVDFSAVDNRPVDMLFAMFSPDNRTHLGLLSRLGYLLRVEDFTAHLRACHSAEAALEVIRAAETAINVDGGETD